MNRPMGVIHIMHAQLVRRLVLLPSTWMVQSCNFPTTLSCVQRDTHTDTAKGRHTKTMVRHAVEHALLLCLRLWLGYRIWGRQRLVDESLPTLAMVAKLFGLVLDNLAKGQLHNLCRGCCGKVCVKSLNPFFPFLFFWWNYDYASLSQLS